jgi:hypothetical protein
MNLTESVDLLDTLIHRFEDSKNVTVSCLCRQDMMALVTRYVATTGKLSTALRDDLIMYLEASGGQYSRRSRGNSRYTPYGPPAMGSSYSIQGTEV